MTEVASLVLTTGVIIASYEAQKNNKIDGQNKLQDAYIELYELNKYAAKLEEKYLPKELKQYGMTITFIYKLTVNKRLDYVWNF